MRPDTPRPVSIADSLLADCVHCGLCLETCPTFVETGREEESPRGRLVLMQGLASGRWAAVPEVLGPLDRCLGCRACETACPSGVQYGRLLEETRAAVVSTRDHPRCHMEQVLVRRVLWRGHFLESLIPIYSSLRGWKWAHALSRFPGVPLRWRKRLRLFPRAELTRTGVDYPNAKEADFPSRPEVLLFRGCVARALFPRSEQATAALLRRAGYAVTPIDDPPCCGAMAHHLGERDLAESLAQRLETRTKDSNAAVIIAPAAGCGAHLKDLDHRESGRSEVGPRFAARVLDLSEALLAAPQTLEFRDTPPEPVAYHDACHLRHGQSLVEEPRTLLRQAGAVLVEPREADLCCGSAGTYNIGEWEMGARLGRRKAGVLEQTGAPVVVTGNPGCAIQIEAHLHGKAVRVESLAVFLARRLAPPGAEER